MYKLQTYKKLPAFEALTSILMLDLILFTQLQEYVNFPKICQVCIMKK